jgi:hypothetical protein
MAVKPENTYIGKIHKLLPKSIYRMKTHNPYVAGVPDCYYSGNGGDLWVEYKYVPKLPVRVPVKIELTALQWAWVEGRREEGRNVAVIVGSPEGGLVINKARVDFVTVESFRTFMLSPAEVAEWITKRTTKE